MEPRVFIILLKQHFDSTKRRKLKRRKLKGRAKIVIFSALSILLILFFLYFLNFIDSKILISCGAAGVITFLNYFAASYLFKISIRRSTGDFMVLALGGMVLRLFLLIIVVVLVLKFLNIDKYAFIFTFLMFYFSLLILEIRFYHEYQKSL